MSQAETRPLDTESIAVEIDSEGFTFTHRSVTFRYPAYTCATDQEVRDMIAEGAMLAAVRHFRRVGPA